MEDSLPLALNPAVRRTLSEHTATSLREAIFGGLFQPGQRLAEAQIASSLRVSRAPVREALATLEQEGLVRRSLNRGAVVARLTRTDVEELCSLRLPLEVLATQRACQLATAQDLERLAANLRETEEAATADRLARLDLAFHEELVRAADHGRLLAAWMNLRSQIHLLMLRRNLIDSESQSGTLRSHAELLEALRDRDLSLAVTLVEEQHRRQHERLIASFDGDGTSP